MSCLSSMMLYDGFTILYFRYFNSKLSCGWGLGNIDFGLGVLFEGCAKFPCYAQCTLRNATIF